MYGRFYFVKARQVSSLRLLGGRTDRIRETADNCIVTSQLVL